MPGGMLLEHPAGWGLAQRTQIQQVCRRPAVRLQPVPGFVLSTVKFTPKAAVSAPTPRLSNLHLTPQTPMQSLSPLVFFPIISEPVFDVSKGFYELSSWQEQRSAAGRDVSHLGFDFPRVVPVLLCPVSITCTFCTGSCWGFTTECPHLLSLPLSPYLFFSSVPQTH